jgi:predicted nuclease of predicted toxin-antitoxin system
MENANRDGRVLITADKDFGELVFRQNKIDSGIILLRLSGFEPIAKAKILDSVLKEHSEELPASFTVITKNSIRIRKK